jgi:hypothetical protein
VTMADNVWRHSIADCCRASHRRHTYIRAGLFARSPIERATQSEGDRRLKQAAKTRRSLGTVSEKLPFHAVLVTPPRLDSGAPSSPKLFYKTFLSPPPLYTCLHPSARAARSPGPLTNPADPRYFVFNLTFVCRGRVQCVLALVTRFFEWQLAQKPSVTVALQI